ncbi:hyaluronidase-1-like [Diretmus argenteus]
MRSVYPALLLSLNVIGVVCGLRYPMSPFSQVPFRTIWNAPSAHCRSRYGVDLDLGVFSIVRNQNQIFMGENITIFYSKNIGLYPHYSQGEPVHGGVPQNASLDEHLRAATENISVDIPDRDFPGLAVVDWESWRPVWERNWSSMEVYRKASKALVRSKHPDWSPARVNVVAREEFEKAGREFMEQTLRLGKKLRPDGLWGYYGFPSCYNYYKDKRVTYTGECPPIEKKRNDELFWLWNVSSALYPDIYLDLKMRGLGKEVLLYAHHRILEAMRVGAQVTHSAPPVFPYARFVYTYSLDFLSQEHLVYTIGESAALGSAGVVLWGDAMYAESQASCDAVKAYMDETLGPYLVNVTAAATLCSQALCSSMGRCQRRETKSGAYLHLDPAVWKVTSEKRREGGGRYYRVLGQMSPHQAGGMKSHFQCVCYPGWGGESCSKRLNNKQE